MYSQSQYVIYKYRMQIGANEHVMPIGGKVVHFAVDPKDDSLCAWISHPQPAHGTLMVLRKFFVVPTGADYSIEVWEHAGTAVEPRGTAWHLLTETIPGGSGKNQFNDRSEYVGRSQ